MRLAIACIDEKLMVTLLKNEPNQMDFSTQYFADIIDKALASLSYPAKPAGLYEPIRYTLEGGGKRIRPVLLLATAAAYNLAPERAVAPALGIEFFHNFTLLHDDVMDNADVRRGRPTVHRRWGNSTAILSGDAMLTMATQFIGRCSAPLLPGVLYLFNRTAMEIYEGQQYDMDFERVSDVAPEEYLEMIRLKTAVLLAASCHIGALIAGASDADQKAMSAYAENLGMAFQLRDDYLDTYGDPALFGKEIGGDIINEKKTYLWIMARRADAKTLDAILRAKPSDHIKVEQVRALYDRLGIPQATCGLIDRYIQAAVDALPESLPVQARTFFTELATATTTRQS